MLTLRTALALSLFAATAAVAQKPATPPTTPPSSSSVAPPPTTPQHTSSGSPDLNDPNPAPSTLKVTFPGLKDGVIDNASVFKGFGCSGENKSLAISWEGAPKDTKSFAVIIHDPDAPTGVGFFHWTVFNLPPTTTKLDLGASGQPGKLPAGAVEGYTDFGMNGYGGPCPPPGAPHRYIVTVYALKTPKIEGADQKATGALLRFMLNQNTLALGRGIATYGRSK